MNAQAIVDRLLEAGVDREADDPESYVKDRLDTWDIYPLQVKVAKIPGAVRRKGEGYNDQWDIKYGNWLFTVSTYEDGKQLWSAHYKTPAFSWDTKSDQKRGWVWSGGGEMEELPIGADPVAYFERLKKMADDNPNVWKVRHIPRMPDPNGENRYG